MIIGLTIIAALLCCESRLPKNVAAFFFMNILVGVMFFILGAPLVAGLQILINAGAVVVLFLVTLHTVKKW